MNSFDRSLLHEYEEWKDIIPDFRYHGLNTYAYLLDKYGLYSSSIESNLQTFDFVIIQLYEGYSHAEYNTTKLNPKQTSSDYVINFIHSLINGWDIDYSTDKELNYPYKHKMLLNKKQIVIGLANGWAGDGKFFLTYPDEMSIAYKSLESIDLAPRGFAFWNILDEGKCSLQRPNQQVWMATGLNRFLKIRDNSINVIN